MIIFIALLSFIATFIGGFIAIKFKDRLHLIIGFSAGAVIGVALFDLIPEAISLGSVYYDIETVMTIAAAGFLGFLLLDRFVLLHEHDSENEGKRRGALGAGSISLHSLIDGISIGLAFQVSAAVGAVVALAVLIHNFSDGINTVTMILKDSGNSRSAVKWLLIDAIAPVIGALSTLFFTLSDSVLAIIISVFSGTFLYIGASELIPESHHSHSKLMTTAMTVLGLVVIYFAIKIIAV